MSLLAHRADRRCVAAMSLATAVAIWHWSLPDFSPWLFALAMLCAFQVTTMNHNHSHRPIWRSRWLNGLTDAWFALFQGHPGFVFEPMHVDNHHRYHNGAGDLTRTDLHRDGNDLPGLLLHPFEFLLAAAPRIGAWLGEARRERPRLLAAIAAQYALLLGVDGLALWLAPARALAVLLLPQVAALFWLLASNYFQHAHTQGDSEFAHSRNFLGWVNFLGFNVGYHSAHHHSPRLHWSELPALHAELAPRIPPRLVESGFASYFVRVFLLGALLPRYRSRPCASQLSLEVSNER